MPQKSSWQESFMSRFSGKADAHHYIVELDQMKDHTELYKQPHLRSFYSNAFKGVMGEARNFCGDISSLRLQQA